MALKQMQMPRAPLGQVLLVRLAPIHRNINHQMANGYLKTMLVKTKQKSRWKRLGNFCSTQSESIQIAERTRQRKLSASLFAKRFSYHAANCKLNYKLGIFMIISHWAHTRQSHHLSVSILILIVSLVLVDIWSLVSCRQSIFNQTAEGAKRHWTKHETSIWGAALAHN